MLLKSMLLLAAFCWIVPLMAQDYARQWKEVEAMQKAELPASVIRLADEIYRRAERDGNFPHMVKAFLTAAQERRAISPDSACTDVRRLTEWIAAEKDPAHRAVLNMVLGNAYHELGMQKRADSRQVTEALSDDPAKWSRTDFLRARLTAYTEALTDMPLLMRTTTGDYALLVEKGEESAFFGHDLLSLMVREMQDRCTDADGVAFILQTYSRAVDCYRTSGNREALGLMELWQAEALSDLGSDGNSPLWKQRETFIATLKQALNTYRDTSLPPYIYQMWVEYEQEDSVRYSLCREALERYPRYKFADFFRERQDGMTSPVLHLNLEDAPLKGRPWSLRVLHRSVPEMRLTVRDRLTGKVVERRTVRLTHPLPYEAEDTLLTLQPLPHPSQYVVEAQAGKSVEKLKFNHCYLRPVVLHLPDGSRQVVVLDNLTGHPVEGAEVEWLKRDISGRKEVYHSLGKATTGRDGEVLIKSEVKDPYVSAYKSDAGRTDTLSVRNWDWLRFDEDATETTLYTYIYTDRAVYRPGQTIQLSGLAFTDKDRRQHVAINQEVGLEVRDTNGQMLARLNVRTNDMGSFSTRVTLPENCMPGQVTIECDNDGGRTTCRVEEYKRPVFEVALRPLTEAYVVNDSVTLTGTAMNYNGTPVAGGKVTYKVIRERFWTRDGMFDEQVLTTGETTVGDDGLFHIPFRLQCEADPMSYDNFTFRVEASVTSLAGETQEAEWAGNAGKESLKLFFKNEYVQVKEHLDSLFVRVTNSNGVLMNVTGEWTVAPYRYKEDGEREAGEPVYRGQFEANRPFEPEIFKQLPSGEYELLFTAADARGRRSEEKASLTLFSLDDRHIPTKDVLWVYQDQSELKPEGTVTIHVGTAAKDACIFYDVFAGNRRLEKKRFLLTDSVLTFRYANKPEYAEGALIQFMVLKDGVVYQQSKKLTPPAPKQELQLRWETFRDRLRPGDTEEWRLKITLPDGTPADAELLATLYDHSLDQYGRLEWLLRLPSHLRYPFVQWRAPETFLPSAYFSFANNKRYRNLFWSFDRWTELMAFREQWRGFAGRQYMTKAVASVTGSVVVENAALMEPAVADMQEVVMTDVVPLSQLEESGTKTGATSETPRSNFAETAFFYPHIRTDKNGVATLAFTLPESLTTWRFLALAHTRDMQYGQLEDEVVASKEFMLQAQLPRFVRVGDEATLSATIQNRSARMVKGVVRMELFDPQTEKVHDSQKLTFEVGAGKQTVASFRVTPTETTLLACRFVAEGDAFSDGEQRYLPVLSNKEWITESKTISVNGAGRHEISLKDLFNRNSRTATERRLTVEYTNHPAWLAVMALPSMAQPDADDAISLASAYYALTLGSHVANAHPRIREVAAAWAAQGGTGETLWSQLQKDRELKNILLEETPWLSEAANEAEQRRRLSTLFDLNTLGARTSDYVKKLSALQRADGAWSWYPGMPGSRYVTTQVVETLLRLRQLAGEEATGDVQTNIRSGMRYLTEDMVEEYKRMREAEEKHGGDLMPSEPMLHYLYLQTLYGGSLTDEEQTAWNYFMGKLERMSSALTIFGKAASAYVLTKNGKQDAGQTFLQSCLEYSVQTSELGRYYDTNIARYSWADYRIPTQVMVIEVCREMGVADSTVQEFQHWLLKQKQVQAWDTPMNSVNAVYALLDGRGEWLDAAEPAVLTLDKQRLADKEPSSALGYVKQTVPLGDKAKTPKTLVVEQKADHLSWGAVYAQYLEQLDRVSAAATGLSIERHLLVRRRNGDREEWQEVKSGDVLNVGDRVLSRLLVTADRDLDFVQIEDKQAACMEPGVVLSGYRWDNGMGYYRVVKDASVRYFADTFRKGVHTFDMEYTLTAPGTYSLGIATIQSAYAPELNAHSAAGTIQVK